MKQIISNGHRLVHKNTKAPVLQGETVLSFRGEAYQIQDGSVPKPPTNSTGRVYVNQNPGDPHQSYYPSVFDLEWAAL